MSPVVEFLLLLLSQVLDVLRELEPAGWTHDLPDLYKKIEDVRVGVGCEITILSLTFQIGEEGD